MNIKLAKKIADLFAAQEQQSCHATPEQFQNNRVVARDGARILWPGKDYTFDERNGVFTLLAKGTGVITFSYSPNDPHIRRAHQYLSNR